MFYNQIIIRSWQKYLIMLYNPYSSYHRRDIYKNTTTRRLIYRYRLIHFLGDALER